MHLRSCARASASLPTQLWRGAPATARRAIFAVGWRPGRTEPSPFVAALLWPTRQPHARKRETDARTPSCRLGRYYCVTLMRVRTCVHTCAMPRNHTGLPLLLPLLTNTICYYLFYYYYYHYCYFLSQDSPLLWTASWPPSSRSRRAPMARPGSPRGRTSSAQAAQGSMSSMHSCTLSLPLVFFESAIVYDIISDT